ncbi:MAG: C2H2-type zinc finger protein [Endozoicomonadaceae bacterium]|nr:C2H2-type zinc finger protein [Endozoicomonadaceae bacterium]
MNASYVSSSISTLTVSAPIDSDNRSNLEIQNTAISCDNLHILADVASEESLRLQSGKVAITDFQISSKAIADRSSSLLHQRSDVVNSSDTNESKTKNKVLSLTQAVGREQAGSDLERRSNSPIYIDKMTDKRQGQYFITTKQPQNTHTGVKIGDSVSTKYSVIDQENKNYLCDTCGVKFKDRSNLFRHMIVHQPIHLRNKPHVCVTCGNAFDRKDSLRQHMVVHVKNKPYVCVTCGKCFGRKSVLIRHDKIHTRDKPYQTQTHSPHDSPH